MEDPNYPCVPIRMGVSCILFMRQHHDISTSPRVDGILITSEIVGCIVDADSLVMVNSIVRKMHS